MEKAEIAEIIIDRLNKWPGVEFEIFFSRKKIISLEIKKGQMSHFRSSQEVGNDLRFFGRLGVPSVLVEEIIISGL